ncbi:MAG: hypothetical protein RSF39_10460, partial [Romboutsia sp.]
VIIINISFSLFNKETILLSVLRLTLSLSLMIYSISTNNYILGIASIFIAGFSISITGKK